jgi:hypothetical protein
MAKKTLSIVDQISALENDLNQKNAQIKLYEKSINKLLKSLFGMNIKEIEKLISEERKLIDNPDNETPTDTGVDAGISTGNSASEGQRPSSIGAVEYSDNGMPR